MKQHFSRRDFLGTTIAGATAVGSLSAADGSTRPIPMRVLGKTGARVTIIGMGCGSRWLSYGDEDSALKALNLAIDSGIGYLDTAYGYNRGKAKPGPARS